MFLITIRSAYIGQIMFEPGDGGDSGLNKEEM